MGVLKIGIHPRLGVNEPSSQQRRRPLRIALVAGHVTGECQPPDMLGKRAEDPGVEFTRLRVTLAVAADVGQMIWRIRIWPIVRSKAHIVVWIDARQRMLLVHDRERPAAYQRVAALTSDLTTAAIAESPAIARARAAASAVPLY